MTKDSNMRKTVITSLNRIVSGNLDEGVLAGDTIVIEEGRIRHIGRASDLDLSGADTFIDANGMIASPGMIDPHVHPSIGDWTPRQNTIGWIEGAVHGGTTTLLSQGAVQVQGRPDDAVGTKALAILARRVYERFRPGGAKVDGGAVILQRGLSEADFKEMASAGVSRIAEIGGGGIREYDAVKPMLEWGKKYGMAPVSVHFGGAAIPTSATMTADEILKLEPELIVHANANGSTADPPLREIQTIVDESDCAIELVFNGNPRMMLEIARTLKDIGRLDRVIIGSDTPTSIGVIPPVILKTVVQIASLNEIPAEKAIALATGNTAKLFGLDTGTLEGGKAADLLLMASTPSFLESDPLTAIEAGDTPSVALVMIDGEIVATRARNTPPPIQTFEINGQTVGYPENPDEYLFGGRPRSF
jgi:enamidase